MDTADTGSIGLITRPARRSFCPIAHGKLLTGRLPLPQTVLEQGGQFAGINRKVQLKTLRWAPREEGSKEAPRIVEALLILKHGGVLTHAGRAQVCCVMGPMTAMVHHFV